MKNLCIRSNSITLTLPQTKFEAILSEDVRGDKFLVQADVLSQILAFGCNNFSSVIPINLILKILESYTEETFSKLYNFIPL